MIGSFVVVFLLCFPVVVHSNNGNNPAVSPPPNTNLKELVGWSKILKLTKLSGSLIRTNYLTGVVK